MNVKRIVCGVGAAATMGAVTMIGPGAAGAWAAACPVFPYASQAPTLTLSTNAPSAGMTISASGCGFTPGATVSVFLLSRHLFVGDVVVDPNGGFDIRVRIPSFFCGPHRVAAVQENPRLQARALIEVFDCRGDDGRYHRHWHHGGHHGWGGGVSEHYEDFAPAAYSAPHAEQESHNSALPSTGAGSFGIAAVGAAMIGGGVLVASRRRRPQA